MLLILNRVKTSIGEETNDKKYEKYCVWRRRKKMQTSIIEMRSNSISGFSFTCTIALPYLEGKEEKSTKT